MIIIPTTKELYDDIISDLEAEYGEEIPVFGKAFLRAMAGVQAVKLKLYYLAIGNLQKNIFIDTAEEESRGGTLERFGRIKLGRNPFPATAGQYTVQVTGTVGAIIPASTTFKSNDDAQNPGKLFILDNAYELVAGTNTITLRALESGLDSKLEIGDGLTATSPIAQVDKIGTVTAETIEPRAQEDIEEYRSKALDAYRLEPQGGAATDYRLWAADAQGVQQAYPYAKSGAANEINLFIEATVADSTDGKGTPSAALLDEVETVVELDPDTTKSLNERGRRPLGVFAVNYLPITVKEIDITVAGFVGMTSSIQTQILNALTEYINTVRPFIAGADPLEDKNDILDVNKIISIILTVRPGSVFGAVTLKVDTVAMSTYTFVDGNIPHLNTVLYI